MDGGQRVTPYAFSRCRAPIESPTKGSMLTNTRNVWARRTRRLIIAAALACAGSTLPPSSSDAATARVRWLPSESAAITHYDVYVRNAEAIYDEGPAWSGTPAPDADGLLEALVTFTPAAAGANYFSIVAVKGPVTSPLSHELPTGTPAACRVDECTTQTSCDFSELPDGTSCSDTTGDPCLSQCRAGVCATATGSGGASTEVEVDRLRFTTAGSTVKAKLGGEFPADTAISPATTGAVVELRAQDGTVLYSSSIAAPSFTTTPSGRRFTFGATRADPDPGWNGLSRLKLRRSGSKWDLTARLDSPALLEASLESTITLVLRMGATCFRRLDATCELKPSGSTCS